MKKFILGLIIALILGIFVNIIFGYIKFDYFKNKNGQNQAINKDIKNCKDLVSGASTFGDLKVTVLGNGKPVENLEVDLSTKPGPTRCMQKTDKNGMVSFEAIPAGQMFIYFNDNAFPKQFGQPPTEPVTIFPGQSVEKKVEFKTQ